MESVLTEIIQLLVGGITEIATGIGTGLGNLVKSIFLEVGTDGNITGLSVYGGVIVIFAGVSLAIALCTRVVMWVESLGK